ncbi:hypothetical protein Q6348_15360 [Isoptericola sp. b441]|uniref:Uncharacterized protein n=1 Tax=Actinotalea lenta TaxID=3064654 RepID=A0ABT9DCF1_9CELL|nr:MULTISPECIES: hypothetical protein [unclassified Isoptericola]MDO8108575.1 hypothetical protein [Isoptericola sp. b441]MDO8119985.1 hypothetical protein [Isoptericola sp. b490]
MSETRYGVPDRCSSCGAGRLTRLPMVLTDGTDVVFVSCQVCERKEWLAAIEGGWSSLPIETVIERTSRRS